MSCNNNYEPAINKRTRIALDFSQEIMPAVRLRTQKEMTAREDVEASQLSVNYEDHPGEPRIEPNFGKKCSCSSCIDEERVHFLPPIEKTIHITIKDNDELRSALIDRIENIIFGILEQLCAGEWPKISYRITNIDTLMQQLESIDSSLSDDRAVSDENSSLLNDDSLDFFEKFNADINDSLEIDERATGSNDSSGPRTVVALESRNSQRKFALIMETMTKLYRLLMNNKTETRRAFFYELKSKESTYKLVSHQSQIDKIVNIIANMLDCAPWDMALIPSAKGLASGDLTLTLENNEKIDYSGYGENLIPPIISNVTLVRAKADFVLVVEKEAVFHKLMQENCPTALRCIMITGKGYPDVATRMLIKILAEMLELPIYILVDADPWGVEIMLTYRYGSINMSYEQGNLACPSARWLGLHPSHFERFNVTRIPLTDSDIAKIDTLCSRPYVTDKVLAELQFMRHGKAEIEGIVRDKTELDLTTHYVLPMIQNPEHI